MGRADREDEKYAARGRTGWEKKLRVEPNPLEKKNGQRRYWRSGPNSAQQSVRHGAGRGKVRVLKEIKRGQKGIRVRLNRPVNP